MVRPMAINRRARGSGVDNRALFANVSPQAFTVVDELAPRLGVSKAELVDEILLHMMETLDSRRLPT